MENDINSLINPIIGPPVLVSYSQNYYMIRFNCIKQLVWKFMKQTFSYISTFNRPCGWIFCYSSYCFSDFISEFHSKTGRLNLIIPYGILKFLACKH